MTELENELYWEMARTIRLLGGKEDILGPIDIMKSELSGGEATEEVFRLVKCWNDNVEKDMDFIPENGIYQSLSKVKCNSDWGE